MSYKLKSTKLWIFIALAVTVICLNVYGTVSGAECLNFLQWIFGLYVAGNAASKVTNNVKPN